MPDETRAGLTAEEWHYLTRGWWPWGEAAMGVEHARQEIASSKAQEGDLFGAAAAALYGEGFGFTRQDVNDLTAELQELESQLRERTRCEQVQQMRIGGIFGAIYSPSASLADRIRRKRSLRDRIAALLPDAQVEASLSERARRQ